jgi:hypothetical protein
MRRLLRPRPLTVVIFGDSPSTPKRRVDTRDPEWWVNRLESAYVPGPPCFSEQDRRYQAPVSGSARGRPRVIGDAAPHRLSYDLPRGGRLSQRLGGQRHFASIRDYSLSPPNPAPWNWSGRQRGPRRSEICLAADTAAASWRFLTSEGRAAAPNGRRDRPSYNARSTMCRAWLSLATVPPIRRRRGACRSSCEAW